jgi:hypothetical protein
VDQLVFSSLCVWSCQSWSYLADFALTEQPRLSQRDTWRNAQQVQEQEQAQGQSFSRAWRVCDIDHPL